eukprot:6040539-Prymnesium_polylepis.1
MCIRDSVARKQCRHLRLDFGDRRRALEQLRRDAAVLGAVVGNLFRRQRVRKVDLLAVRVHDGDRREP